MGPFKVLDKERERRAQFDAFNSGLHLLDSNNYNGQTRHTQMHLSLPFLSQSFGLLILSLRVHNSQTLTVGDIDETHSPNKGKKQNNKQTNMIA